jgi:hypothetical protein
MNTGLLSAVLAIGVVSGCKPDVETEVPPGLDPLEDNSAALPDDESVNLESTDTEDYHSTHARGRVNIDLTTVAACVATPDVGVDRRRVADFVVTEDVDPTYVVSYDVLTTVIDTVTLEYTVSWVQGDRGDGTYGAHWAKTEGSDLLEFLEGSVLLQPIGDTATDVGIIEHLGAVMTSTEDTEQFTGDFYESIRACAHGEPLPSYP